MAAYEQRHGSLLLALLLAGAGGAVWGLFLLFMSWLPRPRGRADVERDEAWDRTRAARRRGHLPADEPSWAAVVDHLPAASRGAVLGAVLGTLFFGGLAALAVHLDRSAAGLAFGLVLAVVLAVAARTGRRVRRLCARLASGQRR